jgi:lauroyl/myristoyl acyltransferase
LAQLKDISDYVVYVSFRCVRALAVATPLPVLRRVLEAIARAVGRFDVRHRTIIRSNLNIAFPEWSEERIERTTARAFTSWARIAAEVLHADRFVADGAVRDDRTGRIHRDYALSQYDEVDCIAVVTAAAAGKTEHRQCKYEATNCFWHAVFCHNRYAARNDS